MLLITKLAKLVDCSKENCGISALYHNTNHFSLLVQIKNEGNEKFDFRFQIENIWTAELMKN